eukprot:TRINITY_DN28709_c0_g1_i1.p1 TRINITY_DN28709_c0_g1~~TRINITY_DN28709_c0_g1_i1.p1  ORF type:complete len:154 (+),score=12.05 TRINITY_DN28709_c0_g1_i1:180-641(+)
MSRRIIPAVPRILKHDHVAVGVKNINQSINWYKNVLGMEPYMVDHPQFRDKDLAMVKSGEAVLALLRLPRGKTVSGTREQKGHCALTITHKEIRRLAVDLPELLKQNKIRRNQNLSVDPQDYGAQLSLFFYDPDDNELELTAWVKDDNPIRFT